MSYICLDCGNVFDEPVAWVEHHGLPDGPGEHFAGCPECFGDFTEAAYCDECNKPILPENLYGGHYCGECLKDSVDFMTGLDYLESNDYTTQFIFENIYDSTVPEVVSPALRRAIRDHFMRLDRDCRLRGDTSFMSALRYFILDEDGDCGKDNYASWMYEYRRAKAEDKTLLPRKRATV